MKNLKIFRHLFNGALLVCTLAVLSACFNGKKCSTCEPELTVAKADDVLLSIDGKPAITVQSLNDFHEFALATSEGRYGPLSKRDAFNTLSTMEVLKRKLQKDGKDQDPKYKKDLERALDYAKWGVNSSFLVKEIQEGIDVSDAGIEKFYTDNAGKNPAFDRAPFLKNPASIRIQQVEFNDQKSAQDFLAKAQKAKDAGAFSALAKAAARSAKDLGNVSQQSQNVDFAIRLKSRSMEPNAVDTVSTSNGKFLVIRAGERRPAQYITFAEVIAIPQMKEMLANFRKQVEVEPEFLKRIEEYKKDFKIDEANATKYFEEEEAKKKGEEDKLRELVQSGAKPSEEATAEKPAQSAQAEAAKAA